VNRTLLLGPVSPIPSSSGTEVGWYRAVCNYYSIYKAFITNQRRLKAQMVVVRVIYRGIYLHY